MLKPTILVFIFLFPIQLFAVCEPVFMGKLSPREKVLGRYDRELASLIDQGILTPGEIDNWEFIPAYVGNKNDIGMQKVIITFAKVPQDNSFRRTIDKAYYFYDGEDLTKPLLGYVSIRGKIPFLSKRQIKVKPIAKVGKVADLWLTFSAIDLSDGRQIQGSYDYEENEMMLSIQKSSGRVAIEKLYMKKEEPQSKDD